ncbi:MAG: CoA transferase [Alphaproteobacteria bacterium]|nr:CoA transferase [Alphaproteobacteria bacterium]
MSFEKPYEGLRVVDLSQGVAGPYCAMLLARQGADVIKVEPIGGDWSRMLAPVYGDNTAYSIPANIGKRSLAVDLKAEAGRAIVERLLPDADVFLEGFRPGVIDRLGYSYDRLSALNAGLIYLSISGFGQEGPLREKPAMDPVLQAFTGFMAENKGPDGIPHRTPTIINDMSTALYAQQAVAAALYARRDDPRGRRINVSLMEAAANLQSVRLMSGYRDGPFKPSMAPNGVFPTKAGSIQIVVIRDHDFVKFCAALGRADLSSDLRFSTGEGRRENADALYEVVNARLQEEPATYWRDAFTEVGLQNEIVQTYDEFVQHPHVEETGLISWLTHPGSADAWPTPNVPGLPRLNPDAPQDVAPRNGQHTREILAELDYSATDIDALAADGVIRV